MFQHDFSRVHASLSHLAIKTDVSLYLSDLVSHVQKAAHVSSLTELEEIHALLTCELSSTDWPGSLQLLSDDRTKLMEERHVLMEFVQKLEDIKEKKEFEIDSLKIACQERFFEKHVMFGYFFKFESR